MHDKLNACGVTSDPQKIVVFGEVLFDCFPDGKRIPGGAPFNVAWNLRALGENPFFVSAVGDDSNGNSLRNLISEWGLEMDGLQEVDRYPTSTVAVSFEDGAPSYVIVEDTAMDHLKLPYGFNAQMGRLLYHGSLAARSEESMDTLMNLREHWNGEVFIDINIRSPWFSNDLFLPLLRGVEYLKLNDEEYFRLTGESLGLHRVSSQLCAFASKHRISNVILTCGEKGAYWYDHHQAAFHHVKAISGGETIDTVGAGDAFSSVCLLGICSSWSPQETLDKASRFAGKVCSLRGATTLDKTFYNLR